MTGAPWRATLLAAIGFGSALPHAAAADDAERIRQLEQMLQASQTAIEQLQRRVGELEQRQDGRARTPAAAAAAGGDAGERTATAPSLQPLPMPATARAEGLPLHGFADVGWARRTSTAGAAPGRNGFRLGTFDLYLAPQLSERVRGLIELAFETEESGALASDLERLQIGYLFGDALTLWAGRFHTPYGYWNNAFHHGAQIQTSITRPRFIAFEDQGGILPAHAVGLWGTGSTMVPWGRVRYDVYASNGNRISDGVLDFNAGGDNDGSPALGFNLALQPNAVRGLTLGLHGLRQKVSGESAGAAATGSARMQMWGGYTVYEEGPWEVIAESYRFRDRDLSGGGARGSQAGFVQVGYGLTDRWTTFARVERARLDALDPLFALQSSGSSYRQQSIGVRFDVDPRAALKLQLDRNRDDANGGATVNWLRTQLAVRF